MNKINLKALRKLIAAASPTPWEAGHNVGFGVHWLRPQVQYKGEHADYWNVADAALVLQTISSLPSLLDALEEARKLINEYHEDIFLEYGEGYQPINNWLARFTDKEVGE